MSTFAVSNTLVDALLTAATHKCWFPDRRPMEFRLPPTSANAGGFFSVNSDMVDHLGSELLERNAEAVRAGAKKAADYQAEPYRFQQLEGEPRPLVVLELCEMYEYNAEESDQWMNSVAREFINALRVKAVSLLEGYNETVSKVWGSSNNPRIFVDFPRYSLAS